MIRLIGKIAAGEEGQALLVVLAFLVFGGLLIVPSVNLISTGLNSVRIMDTGAKGIYAAEAGVEYVMWAIKNSLTIPTQLPQNVNQLGVSMQTESKGEFTVYWDQLVEMSQHADWLSVSGVMVWDAGAQAYKYTITVTWQPDPGSPDIHLSEVGAKLPPGYRYQASSANIFVDNLSRSEPTQSPPGQEEPDEPQLIKWVFGSPRPSVDEDEPVKTETFYITGEGSIEGDYAWVVAQSSSIGVVGELTGAIYIITATATVPGGAEIARIEAGVMQTGTSMEILSWQISK